MAQRTVCLCNGEAIGIETIYTVVDGRQINIPEALKELRAKSRGNQLFCPCGCGSNLILVAGDRNLREQHFRLKDGAFSADCHAVIEGKHSIDSKIVLKCWLEDKLSHPHIESRVAIQDVDDSNRKYEFTFLCRERRVALSYCHERANLSDEKLNILESNSKGITVIYVVDDVNLGTNGQYPEGLMKIQYRQGYCLYLTIAERDYAGAELKATFYAQDADGLWGEILLAEGKIAEFSIDDAGKVLYRDVRLADLLDAAENAYKKQVAEEKERRIAIELRRKEELKRVREQEESERLERERKWEEQRKAHQRQREELLKKQQEEAKRQQEEAKRQQEEAKKQEEDFWQTLETEFAQQERQIHDPQGRRWIMCKVCKKKATTSEFVSYGGAGCINLGICYECNKSAAEEMPLQTTAQPRVKPRLNECPECGGRLVERTGQYGSFMGCSNYPRCKFTRKAR